MASTRSRTRWVALAGLLVLAAALLGFWYSSRGSEGRKPAPAPAASAPPVTPPPATPMPPPPVGPAVTPPDAGPTFAPGEDLTAIEDRPEAPGPHTVPDPPPLSEVPKPNRPTPSSPEWRRSHQEIALGMLEREVTRLEVQLEQAVAAQDEDAAKLLRFRIERTQKRHDDLAAELAGKTKP